jgi:hypothetical protein
LRAVTLTAIALVLLVSRPVASAPATPPICLLNAADASLAGAGCARAWFDTNLSINEIQTAGTAESYKLSPSPQMLSLIKRGSKADAEALNFAEPPIAKQLDANARSLEFDVAYDPKGSLFKYPAGASMVDELMLNPDGRTQNKKRRPIVRLTDTLKPWLESWHGDDAGPYVRFRGEAVGSVKKTFKRHGRSLGFPELSPYTLRHKMATELAARGVSGEQLSRQLGHRCPDLRTTERYVKFDPRHLAEAKAAIEDYLADLGRLTDRALLRPDTSKLLLTHVSEGDRREHRETQIPIAALEFKSGGRHRDRTCDPFHVKEVLSR